MSSTDYICLVLLTIFTILTSISSVQIRKFYVPAKASNEAPLLCNYDLESEHLYDVKWYKDGQQFFRCLPSGETMVYEVDGVTINNIKFMPSGSCSPTLLILSPKSAGEYKCEVNTEGPKFDTISMSKQLKVMEYSRRSNSAIDKVTEAAKVTEVNFASIKSNGGSLSSTNRCSSNKILIVLSVCAYNLSKI